MKTAFEILKEKHLLIENDKTCEAHIHLVVGAMEEYAKQFSSPVEAMVKEANGDINLISGMYAILAEQNSAIWDKVGGKENLANERVKKLMPLMEKLEKEIESRLSV